VSGGIHTPGTGGQINPCELPPSYLAIHIVPMLFLPEGSILCTICRADSLMTDGTQGTRSIWFKENR